MAEQRSPYGSLAVLCTALVLASSPWLSSAALGPALQLHWHLDAFSIGLLSSSLQAGFITGTLVIARAGLADRMSPRALFVLGATLTALSNLGFARLAQDFYSAMALRALTGASLALVYPIALRLAASWFESDRGWVLGWVIAALTLGSAAPHLLMWLLTATGEEGSLAALDWRSALSLTSLAAVLGAILVAVGTHDGRHLAVLGHAGRGVSLFTLWSRPSARAVMLAYFGHMWELYAMWAAIGAFVAESPSASGTQPALARLITFAAISSGVVGCIAAAWYSTKAGERRVALWSLFASGACCLASPWAHQAALPLLITFVCFWGATVIADSAQFTALLTVLSPGEAVGSSILWMNAVGFAISIVSIQLVAFIADQSSWQFALLALAPGPIVGLVALRGLAPRSASGVDPPSLAPPIGGNAI